MKCFYHNDMDGKCAGAIVYKFYLRDNRDHTKSVFESCQFISIDYKDDFPFNSIDNNEIIILVDYSLQNPGDFDKLFGITDRSNVIWIDHHISAIEKHKNLKDIKGLRIDGTAACVLTWDYFYPSVLRSSTVAMLGDYDIWAFKYGDDTRRLQEGIKLYDTDPSHDNWINWLDNDYFPTDVIEAGKVAIKYRDNYCKNLINSHGFMAEFEGHKAVLCNAGLVGSPLFDSVKEDFDLMMPFYYDGKQWVVSIYTTKDIDCFKLAEKYGGGGHKNAAGFQCKELPLQYSHKIV